MTFLAPFMLFGAAAAAIPIVIHLFFRTRYRTVAWAAMKFLLTSIEQTSRRLRFQELLLLLARVAVLALLALALARPLWSAFNVSGKEEVLAVLVVDNSMSMGVRETDKTRLDIARESARRVLEQLPPHAHVKVISCSNQAEVLGPRDATNLVEARELIDAIELVHLTTDLRPGIKAAAAIFDTDKTRSRELYVFSDMQKLGWQDQDGTLTKTLRDLQSKAQINLVRCGTKKPQNAAIIAIVPDGIARPKVRVSLAVMVRNTGTEVLRNLTVTLQNDQRPKDVDSQPIIPPLPPGETRTVPLNSRFEHVGLSILTATVKNDDLEADNTFQQIIGVRDQVRVLIVDGAPNDDDPTSAGAYRLGHALAPINDKADIGKFPIRLYTVPVRKAEAELLTVHDVCILVNCPLRDEQRKTAGLSAEFLTALADFVKQGNGLMIFGGNHVNPEVYNRILGNQYGLLPAPLNDIKVYPDELALTLDRKTVNTPAFLRFREEDHYKGLDNVRVYQTLEVQEPVKKEGAKPEKGQELGQVLWRYSNGKPAILGRKVGVGDVLFIATSADPGPIDPKTSEPTWNELPTFRWLGWVPFVQSCMTHLLERQTKKHNFVAGETIRWQPDDSDAESVFVLIPPPLGNGQKAVRPRLGRPRDEDGKPLLVTPVLERAGVYYLTPAEREHDDQTVKPGAKGRSKLAHVPFAVVPDSREAANLETLSDAELNRVIGFPVRHVSAGDATGGSVRMDVGAQEWTLWLLALVLLLTVGESVLAWVCGRAW